MNGPSRPARSIAAATLSRGDLLRRLNARPWSGRIVRWSLHAPARPFAGRVPDAVIAIPARDERDRIVACLDACAASIRASGLRVRTLVLVNGSGDDTASRALGWSRRRSLPVTVVEVDFTPALAHAGAARRLALELAGHGVARDTALLCTDADARPEPGWVGANAAHLAAGAALVCGRIAIEPREAVRLPARLDALAALENRYRRATLELEHLIDADPWNPWPHHGGAHGASLAIAAGTLADVGGVPLVPSGEDRALLRRVRAAGLRAVHADDVEVAVSARTHGRARGGMADTLRRRLDELDPACDTAFERADRLHARLAARARLRAAWPDRAARVAALEATFGGTRSGDVPADAATFASLARIDAFDRAWGAIETARFDVGRERLRFSELERELASLRERLALVRAASPRDPARRGARRAGSGHPHRTGPRSMRPAREITLIGERP